MDDIQVFDDFFSEDIREEIYNFLINSNKWSFTGGRLGRRFWHVNYLEEKKYFNEYIFKIICDKLDKNYSIERIYANGQTSNQCGNPHNDDGDVTFLYYPNPDWELEDQGHLIFLNNKSDEVSKIITYKSNRAVLFPTNIGKHYSDAPHRLFSGLRISLAYKLLYN